MINIFQSSIVLYRKDVSQKLFPSPLKYSFRKFGKSYQVSIHKSLAQSSHLCYINTLKIYFDFGTLLRHCSRLTSPFSITQFLFSLVFLIVFLSPNVFLKNYQNIIFLLFLFRKFSFKEFYKNFYFHFVHFTC